MFENGTVFGELKIKALVPKDQRPPNKTGLFYVCECSCGNETIAHNDSLVRGEKKSCGCLRSRRKQQTLAKQVEVQENREQEQKRSGELLAINDVYIFEMLNDSRYQILPDGTILTQVTITGKTSVDGTWRKLAFTKDNGYFSCKYNSKNLQVHRIIYAAFVAGKNGAPELAEDLTVNHIDGNRGNNTPSNLELGPHGANNLHRFRVLKRKPVFGHVVLTWEKVRAIRAEKAETGISHKALGEKYGLSKGHISEIINNKIWVESEEAA